MKSDKSGARATSATPHSSPLTPREIEVSAALIFRGGRLLIAKRRPQDHLGGSWEFPGGKREPGESFEDCLRRELAEELGVAVRVGELIESLTHAYPEKTVQLRFFRCELADPRVEPQALGCDAIEWVGAEELARFEFPAADARLVEKLRSTSDHWK